jgi:transcriptional regulator with XRE-family HTH domain
MDIRELIALTKGGRSYADLAKASAMSPSRQRWQQLESGRPALKAFPDPDTIVRMAAALKVSQTTVVLALAESLGLHVKHDSRLVELLPPGHDRLGDTAIATVLAVVRELLPPSNVVTLSPATDRPAPDTRGLKIATDRDEEPADDGSTSGDRR